MSLNRMILCSKLKNGLGIHHRAAVEQTSSCQKIAGSNPVSDS
jgi:hypothetical protein